MTRPATATKAELVKAATALGVELVFNEDDVEALCPAGKRFAGTQVHMFRATHRGKVAWKASAYADLLADMRDGIEDCNEPECDTCTEEEETR
jgi:hypothetical protein